jgi:hypothetical protein
MSARHYCTYFDHRYLPRGLALYHSLRRHAPESMLWVLCLDEECERLLARAALPGLGMLPLRELEAWDPQLARAKASRSLVEYYFTCSPCLPRWVLAHASDAGSVTYLDSDLYFFSSPEPVFAEIGGAPVAITPHRFSPARAAKLERYGHYNVGWLSFDRSAQARDCLEWWRERCIEWCYDRLEDDRFADQKYLDRFPLLFPATHSIAHPGANLAPWNFDGYRIAGSPPTVDGMPLVFFHFQGLKQLSARSFDTRLDEYQARLSPEVRDGIYLPYLRELLEANAQARGLGAGGGRGEFLRHSRGGLGGMKDSLDRAARSLRAVALGNVVRVPR